jgi:hypothetical protein
MEMLGWQKVAPGVAVRGPAEVVPVEEQAAAARKGGGD